MSKVDTLSYRWQLAVMLVRGLIYQLLRLRLRGRILLGRGAKIYGLGNLRVDGVVKIGAYAVVDARFCEGLELGRRCSIGDFSVVRASGSPRFVSRRVVIEANVTFGPYCDIGGGFGLRIGPNCIFGPYVSIHPETHNTRRNDRPIRSQGIEGRGIVIGADNWFGAKVTILDGARVRTGCVFGAAALLPKRRYGPNGVYLGAPAERVRGR